MTHPALPKPEAIASGAATGLRTPARAPRARAAPAPRAAGAFAPTGAGASRAPADGAADHPLALPCVRANRTGGQSTGLSAFRSGAAAVGGAA